MKKNKGVTVTIYNHETGNVKTVELDGILNICYSEDKGIMFLDQAPDDANIIMNLMTGLVARGLAAKPFLPDDLYNVAQQMALDLMKGEQTNGNTIS